jgi:hypothetical protein
MRPSVRRSLGFVVAFAIAVIAIMYMAFLVLDWHRLHLAALQRLPGLQPGSVAAIQALNGLLSAPTLMAITAALAARRSRHPLFIPSALLILVPVHLAVSYVLLAAPAEWAFFQLVEGFALWLMLRTTNEP